MKINKLSEIGLETKDKHDEIFEQSLTLLKYNLDIWRYNLQCFFLYTPLFLFFSLSLNLLINFLSLSTHFLCFSYVCSSIWIHEFEKLFWIQAISVLISKIICIKDIHVFFRDISFRWHTNMRRIIIRSIRVIIREDRIEEMQLRDIHKWHRILWEAIRRIRKTIALGGGGWLHWRMLLLLL